MAMKMQSPKELIMVRPAAFGYDPDTAASNVFQHEPSETELRKCETNALSEFDNAVMALRNLGVKITVFNELASETKKPDSVFPNNWFSSHNNGMIVIYPMAAKSRRLEKRFDIIEYLQNNFKFQTVFDVSHLADEEIYLEGTGSIVFDHISKLAFACRSNRTNINLLKTVCQKLQYDYIEFDAVDEKGLPIYHTNVMMWIGTNVCAICIEAIKNKEEQEHVLKLLKDSKREVVLLTFEEVLGFAGNCLEVVGKTDSGNEQLVLAISTTALKSLETQKVQTLEKHLKLAPVDVSTIEHIGGGGIRCMLAGVHLEDT